uniref:Uncharacterized protein n=1 Tax=Candidatus Methanogaster sp. ANME-2c ERB4 TaxID=2759911 RepID=A0A7G9YGZ3_9EURY|nr:hypothetical protein BDMKHGCF_00020 [Methanosarcinales archaeon ANME-2c ERB4]
MPVAVHDRSARKQEIALKKIIDHGLIRILDIDTLVDLQLRSVPPVRSHRAEWSKSVL